MRSHVAISPRLLPGVRVAGAWISIEPTRRANRDGKPCWKWYVDLPDGSEHEGADLHGLGDAGEMLATLIGFLGACGESVAYGRRTGRKGENADLFPAPVAEWADGASDELAMLGFDMENGDEPHDAREDGFQADARNAAMGWDGAA